MLNRLLIPALALIGTSVAAQDPHDAFEVEILEGWRTDSGIHVAGVRVTLDPEWKTYWRSPGDAGIPPRFFWEGSQNLAEAEPLWPQPIVFHLLGARSIGYEDELLLPIAFTPENAGDDIVLGGGMQIGVCLDVCVPVFVDFDTTLSPGGEPDQRILASVARGPISADRAGVEHVTCSVEPISDGLRITTQVEIPRIPGEEITVIEAGDPAIWVSQAETTREGNIVTSVAEMVPPEAAPFALDRSNVRITLLTENHTVDILGCAAAQS